MMVLVLTVHSHYECWLGGVGKSCTELIPVCLGRACLFCLRGAVVPRSSQQTFEASRPLFEDLAAAQCEHIALTRSFVYYEMGQMQDLVSAYKAAVKNRQSAVNQVSREPWSGAACVVDIPILATATATLFNTIHRVH